MRSVNMHEAKTQLSRLVRDAARGKAFIIAKAGKPLVKVTPFTDDETGSPRRLGFMGGECRVPDDFDDMATEEVAKLFRGEGS